MKRLPLLLALAPLLALAADPVPKPVDTLNDLRPLAEKVTVAAIEFTLPAGKGQNTEKALWDRFANKPEEKQFAVVTARDWKAKWKLLVEVLVAKSEQQKLNSAELRACLSAINMGLTADTAPQPIIDIPMFPVSRNGKVGAIPESETSTPAADAVLAQVPSTPIADSIVYSEPSETEFEATIPVGAYRACGSDGPCWIIVCKWEASAPELTLGHIRIWAVDGATHKIVGFVSCD